MPNMAPPPPRSARSAKRPFVEDNIADKTDEEWTPQKSTSKSPPAPPKTRAAKPSPTASKVKAGHTEITVQVKTYYISERNHPILSGRWWQEITKKPEFWRDFKKFVSLATMKQRFSTSVSVDDIYQPVPISKPVARKKATSSSKPVVEISPTSAATEDTITTDPIGAICQDCSNECSDGRLTCDSSLAHNDDGFVDTIVFKAERKAENELVDRPFGAKDDPIKLEKDMKGEKSDGEDDKLATSPSIARDDMPTLITLEDGSQYIMINGVMKAVKSKVKIPLEA